MAAASRVQGSAAGGLEPHPVLHCTTVAGWGASTSSCAWNTPQVSACLSTPNCWTSRPTSSTTTGSTCRPCSRARLRTTLPTSQVRNGRRPRKEVAAGGQPAQLWTALPAPRRNDAAQGGGEPGRTHVHAIVTTLLHTRLRVDELVRLTWADVTLQPRSGSVRPGRRNKPPGDLERA